MKVAIMQPYFFPYAGYFRLFAAADLFVIYDCVQFPRRGWVHRNKLLAGGRERWITLPLAKCPRETLIKDLVFRSDAEQWYKMLLEQYDLTHYTDQNSELRDILKPVNAVIDYLENTLRWTCEKLDIPFKTIRSSDLAIDGRLRGQDRILAICENVNAKEYINLAGGSALYEKNRFAQRNIQLSVLADHEGSYESIFASLRNTPAQEIRAEINKNIVWKQ